MSCITQYFLLCIEHFTPSKCTIIVEHPTHVEILMSGNKDIVKRALKMKPTFAAFLGTS